MQVGSRCIHLMGTVIEVKIWHQEIDSILDQVEELLYLYKDRFSANDLTSELMEVNLNAGVQAVPVAADLFEMIAIGKLHSCEPHSRLNITIGPLVQAWRIGFTDARVPSQTEIEEKRALINPWDIGLNEQEQSVYLRKKGMAIDLGALAKGYVADRIVEHLERIGVSSGFINLGGNVLTFGKASHTADGLWQIGIQHPKLPRGNNIAILKIGAESVVTSGIYERTLTYEGKTYHHIFDSRTGYPVVSDVASLTVVSKKSIDGEIWTTRLFGGSIHDIYEAILEEGLEAIIITNGHQMIVTPGLQDRIMLLDGEQNGYEAVDLSLSTRDAGDLRTDTDSGVSEGNFGVTVTTDATSGASIQ
ncbi:MULTISPECIES: FAD:protein FMN transferase [unclassified Streptococcus]|uniref:FAD:protein FMN transferase n=1 Tax=unclassified Streptococcus TaxID=2608887 RepID=UPI001071E566|nr:MULTISPECIES: FAD:protein FMN transferase [unclassified Streptococcus]MBF0786535.1 FAD:protein FMN transferase [Streptococcus sp. 19428wC2_LYSM12]MCQ9212308.1 FAD:protein FMN transferase [Streptococcus sp. B01]MCQ9213639.1 FAD:protein FMN transferase [Streptococcus sp. O1]TFV06697.1 FAD:protein FMN transferase [Streptococcus sp. LYSM12]